MIRSLSTSFRHIQRLRPLLFRRVFPQASSNSFGLRPTPAKTDRRGLISIDGWKRARPTNLAIWVGPFGPIQDRITSSDPESPSSQLFPVSTNGTDLRL